MNAVVQRKEWPTCIMKCFTCRPDERYSAKGDLFTWWNVSRQTWWTVLYQRWPIYMVKCFTCRPDERCRTERTATYLHNEMFYVQTWWTVLYRVKIDLFLWWTISRAELMNGMYKEKSGLFTVGIVTYLHGEMFHVQTWWTVLYEMWPIYIV